MKHKYLLLALSFFSLNSLIAQDKQVLGVDFSLTEETKSRPQVEILGEYNGYKYSVEMKGAIINGISTGFAYEINKWGSDMTKPVASEKAVSKNEFYKCNHYSPGYMYLIGSKLYHLVVEKSKNDKLKEVVYVSEYSTDDLSYVKTTAIGEYELKSKKSGITVTSFENKADNSQLGLLIRVPTSDEDVRIEVTLLDESMNRVFEQSFNASSEKDISFGDFEVKDDWIFFYQKNRGGKDQSDELILHLIDTKDNQLHSQEVELDGIQANISDFETTITTSGNVLLSGFYVYSDESNTDPGGAFVQEYDLRENEKIKESVYPFDFDFLTEGMSEKATEKAEKRSDKGKRVDRFDYIVNDIIENEDGTSVLVGERFRFYVTTHTSSNGSTSSTPHYVHSDVFFIPVTKDGEIERVIRYKRYDNSTSASIGDILVHNSGDKYNIVHYDDGNIKVGEVDIDSGDTKTELVYSRDEQGKFAPMMGNYAKTEENKYEVQLVRLGKFRIMNVRFE